jgi:hypothetical protein
MRRFCLGDPVEKASPCCHGLLLTRHPFTISLIGMGREVGFPEVHASSSRGELAPAEHGQLDWRVMNLLLP